MERWPRSKESGTIVIGTAGGHDERGRRPGKHTCSGKYCIDEGGSGLGMNLSGPETPDPAGKQGGEGEPRSSGSVRKRARVLVVDDEAHVRSMIGSTLERQGYEVQLSSNEIGRAHV